eukprot:924845-Pyramimonas_sp.AAC.1
MPLVQTYAMCRMTHRRPYTIGGRVELEAEGELFVADFTAGAEAMVAAVKNILADEERLDKAGAAAANRSQSWNELANGARLGALTQELRELRRENARGAVSTKGTRVLWRMCTSLECWL